jgi:hypothetical protein
MCNLLALIFKSDIHSRYKRNHRTHIYIKKCVLCSFTVYLTMLSVTLVIASNDLMAVNNGWYKMCKEAAAAKLRYQPKICMEGKP